MIEILIVRNPFEPHFKGRQEVVYMDGLSVKDYYPRGDIYIVNGEYLTHPENRIPDDGAQIVVTTAVGGGDFGKVGIWVWISQDAFREGEGLEAGGRRIAGSVFKAGAKAQRPQFMKAGMQNAEGGVVGTGDNN